MSLSAYKQKRDFKRTPEPTGGKTRASQLIFVVQKHAASSLHYDFRLEMAGVLKSWAVPKGPSTTPGVKRLAMMVEDHPYDYKDFEGTIAAGNYGAGTVIVWDNGTYEPVEAIKGKKAQEKHLLQQLEAGSLKIRLHGQKLKGEFALVRTKQAKNSWLLLKHNDEYASETDITQQAESVISGKTLEELDEASEPPEKTSPSATTAPSARKTNGKKKARNTPKGAGRYLSQSVPGTFSPMLATLAAPFDRAGWLYEIKWDGYRAMAKMNGRDVELISRNHKSYHEKYPAVYDAVKAWDLRGIVDGEIVALNRAGKPDFHTLQQWRSDADGQLVYYVFDLLWLDGHDLTGLPLEQRRTLLRERIPESSVIRFSENFQTSATELLAAVHKMGLEGIIAKKCGSAYYPGVRTAEWLKMKTQQRQEVVIGGFIHLAGSPKPFSSLLVGVYEQGKFRYAGKVGTGFSQPMQREMLRQFESLRRETNPFEVLPKIIKPAHFRAHPSGMTVTFLDPELVCEVHFTELTAEGLLRHPAFVAMREDKPAREIVQERAVPIDQIATSDLVKHPAMPSNSPSRKALLPPGEASQTRTVGKRSLQFTNLDKLYWPEDNITKRDLLNYYHQVAPFMLPYLRNRPMSLHRHPDGYAGKSFYQKDVTGKVPDWMETMPYRSEEEADVEKEFLVCTDEASLLYMVNWGCIEINPWSSTVKHPDHPDWCVLDLDPDKNNTFDQVVECAQVAHVILEAAGVHSLCKTSGSTGLHVYIPMNAKYDYEQSQAFARLIAALVQRELPKLTSLERPVSARKGKIYLDFLQNRPQATLAAPYSVRPKPGAPVSMPLPWGDVRKGLKISDFTIRNAVGVLEAQGDLFKDVLGKGIDMAAALQQLEAAWGRL